MGKFIAVASGKGGVGKTTVSINLASALVKLGKDVTLVDGDLVNPNVSLYLGHEKVDANLHSVLKGGAKALDAVYSHPSGMKVVPASIALSDLEFSDYSELKGALEDLRGYSEYVIIDTQPGINGDAQHLFMLADEIIVVTSPELAAATDAMKTIRMAEALGTPVRGIIINRMDGRYQMSSEEIESFLEKPILAVVPEDRKVRRAAIDSYPVHNMFPHAKVSRAFDRAAAGIAGEDYREGIFSGLAGIFRR